MTEFLRAARILTAHVAFSSFVLMTSKLYSPKQQFTSGFSNQTDFFSDEKAVRLFLSQTLSVYILSFQLVLGIRIGHPGEC